MLWSGVVITHWLAGYIPYCACDTRVPDAVVMATLPMNHYKARSVNSVCNLIT